MSNIKAAQDAIKAELKHAREGLAFYQERVASLEDALARLEGVEATSTAAPQRRGRKPAEAAAAADKSKAPRAARKSGRATTSTEKLPATGKDFWPTLIDAQPKSVREIFDAAVAALGITPDKEQVKKLAQRQANALSILCKNGVIQRAGSGRDSRYFK